MGLGNRSRRSSYCLEGQGGETFEDRWPWAGYARELMKNEERGGPLFVDDFGVSFRAAWCG